MKFNWKEFMDKNNKIAVHCKTEEEAIDFCRQMDTNGMKWNSNRSYIDINYYNIYKEKTCYSNQGEYGKIDGIYKEENYKILEWSNYMIKDPIDYLKYGYVVEFENGEFGIYVLHKNRSVFIIGEREDYTGIEYYNKNLKLNKKYYDQKYNIIAIYGYADAVWNYLKINKKDRPIIWEREGKVKKMTVSEICKELGYKVEIIAEE